MAGLEVPLPCGAGGVQRVAGDGMKRRKAPKYDLLPLGDGLMAASQLLHPREPHRSNTNSGKESGSSPLPACGHPLVSGFPSILVWN